MDPSSALGVVAAVVQFVDFGSRILQDTREIYREINGQPTQTNSLSTVASDISTLMNEVEQKYTTIGMNPQSEIDRVFIRLCRECRDISQELKEALSKIQQSINERRSINQRDELQEPKSQSRTLSERVNSAVGAAISLKLALTRVWDSGKVSALKIRLGELREQIMTAALLLLWDTTHQSHGNVTIFSQQQGQILESLQYLVESTNAMKMQGITVPASKFNESRLMLESRVQGAWAENAEEDVDFPGLSEQPISDVERKAINRAIMQSLVFETISSRETAIPRAHEKTFQWIFEAPPKDKNGQSLWSDFVEWLESQTSETFWITGKPGAGKSTLLRCIIQKNAFGQHLSKWAAGKPTLLACFYSWNSGTKLQRTQEGMLRTIIHQYLSQRPDLIALVLPRRFKLLHDFGLLGTNIQLPDWEMPELLHTIYAIISASGPEFKLVLIIDGLDEFEEDHDGLIKLVQRINLNDSVKMCVSSRPWNAFKDAFDDSPHLKLENLTRKDIEAVVWHSFKKNRGFRELEIGYPQEADKLRRDIVDKATGVFLWVDLVVKTLLNQLTEGASFSELQATLDDLPDDLSQLYERIWRRIEPKYRGEACELIRILEITKRDDVWLTLQLVWLCHPDCTLANIDLESLSNEALEASLTHTARRLKSRARDLLEVPDIYGPATGMGVDYLHRTARDWILEEQNWQRVLDQSPHGCDPAKTLLKAMAIQLEPGDRRFFVGTGEFKEFGTSYISSMLKCARDTESPDDPIVFDCLDRVEAAMIEGDVTCWAAAEPPNAQPNNQRLHQNCFASFCACISLSAYVKHQVPFRAKSQSSERLDSRSSLRQIMHSVLYCAILGLHNGCAWIPKNIPNRFDENRINLVEFLLLNGTYTPTGRQNIRIDQKLSLPLEYRNRISSLLEHCGLEQEKKRGFKSWIISKANKHS